MFSCSCGIRLHCIALHWRRGSRVHKCARALQVSWFLVTKEASQLLNAPTDPQSQPQPQPQAIYRFLDGGRVLRIDRMHALRQGYYTCNASAAPSAARGHFDVKLAGARRCTVQYTSTVRVVYGTRYSHKSLASDTSRDELSN